MVLLPEITGFFRTGEKQNRNTIFACTNCSTQVTVKSGKTIPTCPKCKEHVYWIKITEV